MAKRIVFYDEKGNELNIFVNTDSKLFISAGSLENEPYNGFVALDKEDAIGLWEYIDDLIKEM